MKQLFKDIILENQEFSPNTGIKRQHMEIPVDSEIIISIIGARRSGKTFLLYQLIEELKKKGLSNENIVFINFEDERLSIRSEDLDGILQAYQELYPHIALNTVYFFFDEIQNFKGWERFVRRLYDTKSKNIFVTGSNSKLLSSEIATELRGRTVSYTLFPFNFNEFILANNGPDNINTSTNRAKILKLCKAYMFDGGFPETVRFNRSFKIKLLQEYFNVMIYRDIIERYSIANVEVLKFFIKKILASVTVPVSINKAYNDLRSMGYKVSNKYLYEYMNYCNAVFLTQSINKFDYSEIKQSKSDKKAYAIDNGLLSAIDYSVSDNHGKLMENMVAMELIKNKQQVYYYKDKYECDFIIQHQTRLTPIQVAYSIANSDTRKREIRGLLYACKSLEVSVGTIITFEEEEEFINEGITIAVIPFYKYFLNKTHLSY